ncbi:MAG: Flp family type IVb pilin [Thermaurantiacus tibetensis]|uniref:Flp family type IVb pilin n=1 Tax=Thermaurantiacus tibetensis TaxID=2759035 RepID=UPI00188F5E67|nr:Flp family type IVb pilin [Thermaurantiacus tibetensis]
MKTLLTRLVADRQGATAIEYGLIAAFVALAIVATLPSIRNNLNSVFGKVNTELAKGASGK